MYVLGKIKVNEILVCKQVDLSKQPNTRHVAILNTLKNVLSKISRTADIREFRNSFLQENELKDLLFDPT